MDEEDAVARVLCYAMGTGCRVAKCDQARRCVGDTGELSRALSLARVAIKAIDAGLTETQKWKDAFIRSDDACIAASLERDEARAALRRIADAGGNGEWEPAKGAAAGSRDADIWDDGYTEGLRRQAELARASLPSVETKEEG